MFRVQRESDMKSIPGDGEGVSSSVARPNLGCLTTMVPRAVTSVASVTSLTAHGGKGGTRRGEEKAMRPATSLSEIEHEAI